MSHPTRKVLLDECVDGRLARHLKPFSVTTVPKKDWSGVKNGRLLRLAQSEFDVFITVDRNLSFQQNLIDLDLAVIVLCAKTNRLDDLLPLVPQILELLTVIQSGHVVSVS